MNILDLRQTSVRQLEPLLEEEARHWHDELHWDYRGALDLIKRFLEAHALCGCVAFENGSAAGYSFYVLEEQKGLIGGLYVSPRFPQADIGRRLLEEMLFSMRALPQLSRSTILCATRASSSIPDNSCCSICTRTIPSTRRAHPRACAWTAGMIASSSRVQN
jgi:GNAT superfamily N-acetyltransferase